MTDVHSAVGSYVADALTPLEQAEFETHLAGCYRCRLEAAEYAETVAMLTPLVAASPPARLRTSVLAAINTVQPLAPEVVALSEERARLIAEHGPNDLRPMVPATVTELRPLGPDEVTPLDEHPSVLPDSSWLGVAASLSDDMSARRSRRTDRILVGLVAAALVVALAFSGWIYVSWQQDQTQVTEMQQENELLTAPDVEIYTSTAKNGAAVSYVVSETRDQAMFIANDLPDPGTDRLYQLWTIEGDAATSAGLVREGGSIRQLITGNVEDADSLGISIEPAPGGSTAPTDPSVTSISNP